MLYAVFSKLCFVVLRFVQSHNKTNIHLFKDGYVVLWSERAISISHVKWSRESHELAWKNPVKISVFYLFEVLILLHVECCIIIPAQCNCVLETLETV